MYRAGTAHADAATFASAKQFVFGPQNFEQRVVCLNGFLIFHAVYFELDDLFHAVSLTLVSHWATFEVTVPA